MVWLSFGNFIVAKDVLLKHNAVFIGRENGDGGDFCCVPAITVIVWCGCRKLRGLFYQI